MSVRTPGHRLSMVLRSPPADQLRSRRPVDGLRVHRLFRRCDLPSSLADCFSSLCNTHGGHRHTDRSWGIQTYQRQPPDQRFITAIGVSFLLENLGLVAIGGRPKTFPIPSFFEGIQNVGKVQIPNLSIWVFLVTAVLLVGVMLIVHRTKVGMAMRALSRDMETVRLMGVDVNRVISFTFCLGSALAAAGGILWCMKYPAVEPFMGVIPGLKAFVAAVLGGIGSVSGAAIGGLILGLAEIMIVAIWPEWSGYRDATAFLFSSLSADATDGNHGRGVAELALRRALRVNPLGCLWPRCLL